MNYEIFTIIGLKVTLWFLVGGSGAPVRPGAGLLKYGLPTKRSVRKYPRFWYLSCSERLALLLYVSFGHSDPIGFEWLNVRSKGSA